MPYIITKDRDRINEHINNIPIDGPGQLNYAITRLMHNYVLNTAGGKSYFVLNEVIGVVEDAKLEFYRVVVAPYEDAKRKENGNISELDR